MKVELRKLGDNWILERHDTPHNCLLLHSDQRGTLTLLAYLGLAEFEQGKSDPVLKPGVYEL